MSLKKISTILFYISALALIALTYKVFTFRINDFVSYAKVYGLKRISASELKTAINYYDLRNKFFYQINPHDLSNSLAKRPLIKKIKIRTSIYPRINYKIYIMEQNPWAVYRGQILNDETEIIIKSKNDAKLYNSPAVADLYKDLDQLIEIKTHNPASSAQLKSFKKLSDLTQENLSKVGQIETVKKVVLDKEDNLFIHTQNLVFKFGALDSKIFKRAEKLNSLFNKMKTLSPELEYIDLSLSSNEILLGKRNQKETLEEPTVIR